MGCVDMGKGKGNRPLLVTILGILGIILGLLGALLGVIILVIGGALLRNAMSSHPILAALGGIIGGFVLLIGLIEIAVGWGFIKGMTWSWWVAVILYAIGLIGAILDILSVVSIIPLIIDALLLYYLTRPNVKSWFGVK